VGYQRSKLSVAGCYCLGNRGKSAIRYPRVKILFWWAGVFLVGVLLAGCRATAAQDLLATASVINPSSSPTISPYPVQPSSTPDPPTTIPATYTPVPPTPSPSPSPTIPWPPERWLFPDSEVVFSPSALHFDVGKYLNRAGGFLSTYRQYLMLTGWSSGADVVTMVALENSINPRLLLALLEYQSGCVRGQVDDPGEFNYAMGATQARRPDLYGQLVWVVHELSEGYYGWRNDTLTEFSFADGTIMQPLPDSNAGTVALQYLFSRLYEPEDFESVFSEDGGFLGLYADMFDDPWERAVAVEPLVPPEVEQPLLTLPFGPGLAWAYTGGPHQAFESNGPLAALDFAPPTSETGCYQSENWVLAMADGLVVRSGFGVVVQDLDDDGYEQTGWALMYLHIEERDRVPLGTFLQAGDPVGHPSCEGGRATGTHVHITRKYNGEWIEADGEIPFVMDGWTAHAGEAPYLGTLIRNGEVITAHRYGSFISRISRDE
jgi:LasA protease